jgi:hypothetical protein
LKKLKAKGYVKRSSGDHRIYELTPEALDPVRKTLRNLATISPVVELDVKKGKELLTPDVVDALLKIAILSQSFSNRWETLEDRIKEQQKIEAELRATHGSQVMELELTAPSELNEYLLLKALARYDVELKFFSEIERDPLRWAINVQLFWRLGPRFSPAFVDPNEFVKFYKANVDDPRMFPITALIKKVDKNVSGKLDELLEWIRPLIESQDVFFRNSKGSSKTSRPFWTDFLPVSDVTIVWWLVRSVIARSVFSGQRSLSMMETNSSDGRTERMEFGCQRIPSSFTSSGCPTW